MEHARSRQYSIGRVFFFISLALSLGLSGLLVGRAVTVRQYSPFLSEIARCKKSAAEAQKTARDILGTAGRCAGELAECHGQTMTLALTLADLLELHVGNQDRAKLQRVRAVLDQVQRELPQAASKGQ